MSAKDTGKGQTDWINQTAASPANDGLSGRPPWIGLWTDEQCFLLTKNPAYGRH